MAYQVTDDTNVFVRWSTGYRSGGYNGEIYNNPFEEETIEQWELGVKSDILPGTLRVNASIFSYVYDDLQVSQIKVSPHWPADLLYRQRGQGGPLGLGARAAVVTARQPADRG